MILNISENSYRLKIKIQTEISEKVNNLKNSKGLTEEVVKKLVR